MPSPQSQEGALTRPLPSRPQALITHGHFAGLLLPGDPPKATALQPGVHFPHYKTDSSPFSPIRDQAAPLSFGLQFVRMQNGGGRQRCYEESAVVADHRQSKWAPWSQAARGCVTLTSCGTSLGLSLLIPKARLTPPTSRLWSNPAHMANGRLGQPEHPPSICASRPYPPTTPGTTPCRDRTE